MIAAHHQRSTCGSENVGRSLIKSGIEHQPSMILTATWCLRTWEQAKLMLMRHGMRCTHVCEQSAHFARACGVRMWHTAAEHTEIQRTIPTSSAERPTWQGWCGSPCCRNLALPVSARCAVSTATQLPQRWRWTEPTAPRAWRVVIFFRRRYRDDTNNLPALNEYRAEASERASGC